MPETYNGEEWVTPEEAAALRGMAKRTIYVWRQRGVLRTMRTPGGRLMIAVASLGLRPDTPTKDSQ